jgi:putative membrane protein
MIRLLATTAIAVALMVPAAFAQTSPSNSVGGQPPATVQKGMLDQQELTFIKEASAGRTAEIELSKIATKSANPEVKRFAERMVRDHTAAGTELTRIATELGVAAPTALDVNHQKIRDQLQSMHGPAFDRQYMEVMVDDHDQAVKLFDQEASSGHDARLKQFAQTTLPTIEEHHKMALDLSRRLSETAAK